MEITKKQLAEALAETALALTLAMPDLVKSINQNDPAIALKKTALLAKTAELSNSVWANLFMQAMCNAIEKWDDPSVFNVPGEMH